MATDFYERIQVDVLSIIILFLYNLPGEHCIILPASHPRQELRFTHCACPEEPKEGRG